jgi:hypothetical protein
MLKILPIGGRIKAASIGLDRFTTKSGVELDKAIAQLRRDPCEHLRRAFFPRTGNDLRHMTSGVGLYRPILKTDQGMPGNFLPFMIDPTIGATDLSVRTVHHEEGVAIPEAWHKHSNGYAAKIQSAFLPLDLHATYLILQDMETRRAEKGRLPFMFIRPALPDRPIVFGSDVVQRVEAKVAEVMFCCLQKAEAHEQAATGRTRPHNLIWAQPDVYLLTDGTVAVERINCPDVGFFLANIMAEGSIALPHIQSVVKKLCESVADHIIEKIGRNITIVTRGAVLEHQQDVLEIREIEILGQMLSARGAKVYVIGPSDVDAVEVGSRLLLMNLDYEESGTSSLLRRHAAGEVECFPNPYVQITCRDATGLAEIVIERKSKHGKLLFERARSRTTNDREVQEVIRLIGKTLRQNRIEGEILHAILRTETVPVLREALHSWRQLVARAERPENAGCDIRIRTIPVRHDNLLLTSSTGSRLHAFRFMCIA